ncbi:MAG: hypothetical protein ACM3XO_20850 [Bacteroidota bacterium]|jgi:hypothetical protein
MSELSETFKRAILTFTHASDFIISLYEGASTTAEEMVDRIAEERKMYQVPADERIAIENEIGAMVAFPSKLLPAFLIMQMSFLEDWLLEICQIAAGQENISSEVEQSDRFTIEQAKRFFEEKLWLQFPSPWPAWEELLQIQLLRDGAVNHTGLEVGRIDDAFLVDVNRTIVAFLEELRTYLPEAAK